MFKPIKIKNVNEIEKINAIVSKYPYEIWIHATSGMADAKSILGMFVLKLNEPLVLVVPDDVDSSKLFKDLKEYIDF
jgi:phosphotransferase system HPr-like phosphotransfer protein